MTIDAQRSSKKSKIFHCLICHKPIQWMKNSPFRPFCSERCQLIDFNAWINETYSISEEKQETDGSNSSE